MLVRFENGFNTKLKPWTHCEGREKFLQNSTKLVSNQGEKISKLSRCSCNYGDYCIHTVAEEKQLLESSLRRRSRSVEQVWRHYEQLKARVASGMGSFPYKSGELSDGPTPSTPVLLPLEDPSPPSDSVERLNPHGPMDLSQTTTSCLEVVASTLRTLGVEILDEDQRVSPVAGVALTVVLVLTICILSHCVT